MARSEDYSDSVEIAVAPAVAFAALSDLAAMGRRSPENTGGEWLANASGPAVGAKFRGTNTQGSANWSTNVRVAIYDPPHCFAFEVTYGIFRISRWEFCVESTREGCRVIEKWKDRRNFYIRRSGDKDGFDRAAYTKTSIRTTLDRLKAELES